MQGAHDLSLGPSANEDRHDLSGDRIRLSEAHGAKPRGDIAGSGEEEPHAGRRPGEIANGEWVPARIDRTGKWIISDFRGLRLTYIFQDQNCHVITLLDSVLKLQSFGDQFVMNLLRVERGTLF